MERLDNDLKSLEPLQRLKMIIELSKFVVPTLKANELTTIGTENGFNPITVHIINEDELKRINAELEAKY